jgi:hypothetical protein
MGFLKMVIEQRTCPCCERNYIAVVGEGDICPRRNNSEEHMLDKCSFVGTMLDIKRNPELYDSFAGER